MNVNIKCKCGSERTKSYEVRGAVADDSKYRDKPHVRSITECKCIDCGALWEVALFMNTQESEFTGV